MDSKNIIKLIIAVIACEVIGAIGTIFTTPNIPNWYATLTKPFFSPPNWLFAPVWITLFLLMGVAFYIIWVNNEKKFLKIKFFAMGWFGVQFAFNVLWSFLFFGLRSPFLGLVGIVCLWFSIVATIIYFYKINKKAAYLLIPYLLWVSFASLLNYFIFLLN